MPSLAENDRMRKASGAVDTDDRLAAFLYALARDALPIGEVERLVDLVSDRDAGAPVLWKLTNGWLAAWAIDAAERLRPVKILRQTGPITQEDVDDFFGGVVPPGRWLEGTDPTAGVCSICSEIAHDATCPLAGVDGRPVEPAPALPGDA